jgi:hypothetical protein
MFYEGHPGIVCILERELSGIHLDGEKVCDHDGGFTSLISTLRRHRAKGKHCSLQNENRW